MLSSPMKVFKTEPDESIQISFLNKSWLNRCDVFVIYDIASFLELKNLLPNKGWIQKESRWTVVVGHLSVYTQLF